MDKGKQEKVNQKKSNEKFNSITQKVKPENQNQTHNVRSEAVEPKIRQIQTEILTKRLKAQYYFYIQKINTYKLLKMKGFAICEPFIIWIDTWLLRKERCYEK